MSSETIKQEIVTYNDTKTNLVSDLDKEQMMLIEMLKPFIKSKLQEFIEDAVKHNPDHTKSLGLDKLSQIKNELANLLNESDALVSNTFSNNKHWIHVDYHIVENGDSFGQQYNNQKLAKEKIISGIKTIFGKAGKILIDYQYKKANPVNSHSSEWQITATSEIVYGSNYGFQIPDNIEKAMKTYADNISKLHNTIDKLAKLTKALNEQEALDLWDQA